MNVTLSPAEYIATVERIARVNARAAKKGFTGSVEISGDYDTVTSTNLLTGIKTTTVVVRTTITGAAPSYNGWTFLARVDAIADTFTLAVVPGVEEQIDRSLVRPGACDHCNHNRARKNSYLVRNDETGQIRNVGSSCIKDFLGHDISPVFVYEDDIQREIDAAVSGPTEVTFDVLTVLRTAYAATRALGWTPASAYDGRPTRDWVLLALNVLRPTERDTNDLRTLHAYADEADAKAIEIRDWVLSLDNIDNNYYANLRAAVEAGIATPKQIGLLVSAPNAYARSLEIVAERAVKAKEESTSEWIANVKDKKVRIEGTITAIRFISSDWGTTVLYTILTTEGNVVKWFASREALGEKENVEVVLEGTIKGHEEYNGVKQTVVTRCKQIV